MNQFWKNLFSYSFFIVLAGLAGISSAFLILRGSSLTYQSLVGVLPATVYDSFSLNNGDQIKIPPGPPIDLSSPKLLPRAELIPEKPPSEVRLVFVGDIMLDRGVRELTEKGGGDFNALFKNVPLLREADITFGNLEGPLSDRGADRYHLYSFRMLPETLPAIKEAGFDALSVANNHAGDWGKEAFIDTLNRLRSAGIAPVGGGLNFKEAEQPVIFEREGTRFGFLGFTDVGPDWLEASENQSGILLASNPRLAEIIETAKSQADVLIVSYHFGEEYAKEPTKRQQTLAYLAVDSGADLVIGHHPHVVEPLEHYRGGLIAYSLGNFIFDQGFSEETMTGLLLEVVVKEGKLASFKEHQVKLNSRFQPKLEE